MRHTLCYGESRFSTPKICMPYLAYLMYVVQCRIYDIRRTYNDVLECRVIHCDAHTHTQWVY